MIADIIYRGKVISEKFPKNDYQLSDLTDRMRSELPFNVRIDKLFGWDNVNNELRIDFFDDLVRLNLLAQRIEEMDEIEEAKMFALMTKYPEAEIYDGLQPRQSLQDQCV